MNQKSEIRNPKSERNSNEEAPKPQTTKRDNLIFSSSSLPLPSDFGFRISDFDLKGLSLTEKRMLVAELLREKAKQDAAFPLSHGQRGLWFVSQLDRDSAAYNLFFPARIRSRIDVPAFRRALKILIARHPSLRTTFEQFEGELRQREHSSLAGAEDLLEIHDASSWSEEVLHERIEEEAYRPLDLERGPLVR